MLIIICGFLASLFPLKLYPLFILNWFVLHKHKTNIILIPYNISMLIEAFAMTMKTNFLSSKTWKMGNDDQPWSQKLTLTIIAVYSCAFRHFFWATKYIYTLLCKCAFAYNNTVSSDQRNIPQENKTILSLLPKFPDCSQWCRTTYKSLLLGP